MRQPRPVSLVVLGMLWALAPAAHAQSRLPLAVDQRVRIWTAASEAITGRVTAVSAETVQIAQEGRGAVTVAAHTVRRLEINRARSSRGAGFRNGALRGALIMGALGALSLGLQHDVVGEDGSSAAGAAALGAWSGGLFGGLIGGGIGAARAGDRWEQVWP